MSDMDLQELERQFHREHDLILAQKDDELASLKADLEFHVIGSAIADAIADEGGSLPLLASHVRGSVKMVRDADDLPVVVVVGSTGLPRLRPGATNMDDLMTIGDLVKTLRDDPELRSAFDDSDSSGTVDDHDSGSQGPDDVAWIL